MFEIKNKEGIVYFRWIGMVFKKKYFCRNEQEVFYNK